MLRKLLIAALVTGAVVAPAGAATQTLLPGVTYERAVQFTPHGPVALHVVRGPRPTGLYALKPVLSNETVTGTERVSAMQRRLSTQATMVGVNGDMFNWETGRPSGILMRNGVVHNQPYGDRSSVGISAAGALDVRRIEFFGTWRGTGQRRAINALNQLPGANGIALFTPSYGAATPVQPGVVEAVLDPLPPATPNTDLTGPVVQHAGGGTAIPAGGAVLVARGTAAQRLAEEAPPGTNVTVRIIFRPEWTGITDAIGGGPVIVRNGAPVFRALEAFEATQLLPRNPRTAVGQLPDGRILLVVTDGRRAGYSVGMTNFELAQTLVRLGAVTASALDAGGSSTLAFDGQVLNRPSDPGGERAVSTSLQLMYYGVYAPPAVAVVSPNADGVDETQRLAYKVVRSSNVVVRLTAPDGSVAFAETVARTPGVHPVAFPPVPPGGDPAAPPAPAEGRWRLDVSATDDLGRTSTTRQQFAVNNTLGFVRLASSRIVVRPRGGQRLRAGVTLTRPARVTATIETPSGVRVAIAAVRQAPAGRLTLQWPGTTNGGRNLVYSGRYVLRFRAVNELGAVELASRPFTVIRAAAKPKPKPPKRTARGG